MQEPDHGDLPIIAIGVKDPGFTLDLMARECPPTQFVREYTKNGIEAVDAYRRLVDPDYRGKVLWTVAPDTLGLSAPKLAVIDSGIGMSADELPAYINDLTASGKTRSLHDNYGVGAKVSAARYNPAGVLYFTWRDGIGSYVELGRDRHGTWGMRQHRRPDGSVEAVLPAPEELKPTELADVDHGTMVVFLGEHPEHDTTQPPDGSEHRDRWIAKYLNRRFYRIPDWVEVRAREERAGGAASMRQIRGQKHFLDQHTQAQGAVEIPGALVRWRALTDETDARRQEGNIWAATGHRAALHRDELYELISPARGGYQKLQEFGIHTGYARVVLYVEPTGAVGAMTDTARTRLLVDGEPLPWDRYAEAFEKRMPDEIRALIEEAAGSTARDYRKAIRERLEAIRDLFKVPRYKAVPAGALEMEEPTSGHARDTDDERERKPKRDRPSRPWTGPAAGNVYALMLRPDGVQADTVRTDKLPDIQVDWVSATDRRFGERAVPHLEDRAARYDLKHNRLEINFDFRGLQDLIGRWHTTYKTVPGSRAIIEETVLGWYEQQLTETVLGVLALRGSEYWDNRTIADALSELALTAAAGARYHLDMKVKQELAQRFSHGRRAAA
jgi:hypothetical protein